MKLQAIADALMARGFTVQKVEEADPFDSTDSEITLNERVHIQVGYDADGAYMGVARWVGQETSEDYGLMQYPMRTDIDALTVDVREALDAAALEATQPASAI